MKKLVTRDEIDRFVDYMGINLLPYQRELLVILVNHNGPIYFMPARQSGRTSTQILLELLSALYKDV